MVLDEDLLRDLKARAAREGRTLQSLTNDLLRQALDRIEEPTGYRLRWKTWRGELRPGVDISDRDSLYEIMEGRAD